MAEKKLSEKKHPKYEDNLDKWELYYKSAKGGKDFINETNLFTHRLEDSTDYDERLDRGYFLNYCEALPEIYNSFIFRENIIRPADDILDRFRKNVDKRETDISRFIIRAGFLASVYGVIHAIVDMPPVVKNKSNRKASKAETKDLLPFCKIIKPTDLVDWSVDSQGNFNWIVLKSTHYNDLDPYKKREEVQHYKLITTTEWSIQDREGNVAKFDDGRLAKGPNELGIVPIITMYHKEEEDDKIGDSMLRDIVRVNRIVMNWCSCIDEQVERQTFSQLVIPDDGTLAEKSEEGDDPLYSIGTSSMWTATSDSKWAPQFISPDTGNIDAIWKLVIDHIKEMYRMAGLQGGTSDLYASKSGKQTQMNFMGVNSALADKANKYQIFEREIGRMVYRHMDKDPDELEETIYPSSFDIGALEDEIESHMGIMERNFSVRLNKVMQKNIARRVTPLAPNKERKEMEDEIESGDGIVEPIKTGPDNETGSEGNPHTTLSNTSKTSTELHKEEVGKHKKEE